MKHDIELTASASTLPRIPVRGRAKGYPVRRIFCVGLNYQDHAKEMGRAVERSAPFYFTKSPFAIVHSGAELAYPPGTSNYHHEVELVVAIGQAAHQVQAGDALECVFAYGCGIDLTRRDLQLAARDKGRPWDLGKDFEESAAVSELVTASEMGHPLDAGIWLTVNGEPRQRSDLGKMIWSVAEIISDLSRFYHLEPGDLIYTGTPHGVGPLLAGDQVAAGVDGIATLELAIASGAS